jgi:hypothetical protein
MKERPDITAARRAVKYTTIKEGRKFNQERLTAISRTVSTISQLAEEGIDEVLAFFSHYALKDFCSGMQQRGAG